MERTIQEQVGDAVWESWPVGARMAIADAQATIAALQARVMTWEERHNIDVEQLGLQIEKQKSQLTQRTAERDTARRRVDELEAREVDVVLLRDDLEQRTAELEAAKQNLERRTDECNEISKMYVEAHAELERVRRELVEATHNANVYQSLYSTGCMDRALLENELRDIRTLIAALPKVEGAVVVSNGYVKDSTRCHALFGADEDAALYAALLQHRQGMEG